MKDKTKGDSIGESVCLKPKMYSVFPADHDSKTSKTDIDFEKELEEEEYRKSKGGKKYNNLTKNYGDYLKKLRAEKNLNDYIKIVAVKMFSNEEVYILRLENYRKRYANNDLYVSLEKLYELYYYIAKEKIAKDQIMK
ncbi:2678_t:CDS:2 [Funneliformis mosseae]|uniref:2678_t:CDS:1 n=1 Tax=Funneliformis mosseae TaxID=27381 RepID=A0A9N9G5J4_FUNMO|nr:2678_t:CDS:2 [Funneliformis mosseae]